MDSVNETRSIFFNDSDAVGNIIDQRKLIIALAMKFSNTGYRGLDMRWEMVSKIAHIAELIRLIDQDCAAEKT